MALIETHDLRFVYGKGTPFEKVALDGVDISINEGEFIGVIGHTGSGTPLLGRCKRQLRIWQMPSMNM